MTPFLFYPVKDRINSQNLFGANPAEYLPLGQNGHPGNDFESVTGTPLYCPVDGLARYNWDSLGGDGIWIKTTQQGQNYNIILWHMPTLSNSGIPTVSNASQYPFQIPTDGNYYSVKAGQLLGYTDNSGYHPTGPSESTAQHLHLGIMPANENWAAENPHNGYLGCISPTPFYNGLFAEDIGKPPVVIPPTPIPLPPTLPPQPTIPQVKNWLTLLIEWLQFLQK